MNILCGMMLVNEHENNPKKVTYLGPTAEEDNSNKNNSHRCSRASKIDEKSIFMGGDVLLAFRKNISPAENIRFDN